MGIALSTAGITVSCAMEETAGTRPTTGYKLINDITSTPDFNVEPNGIDVTPLSETVAKQYVQGLRDYGSSLTFGALLTTELITRWGEVCSEAQSGKADNKRMWFQIAHPSLTDSVYFPGDPADLGAPATEVDSAYSTNVYVTPQGAAVWEEKVEPGAA